MGRHDARQVCARTAAQAMFRLDGRVAFISAAAGHLGSAMTRALAGAGAQVIINGRDDGRLKSFEQTLQGEGFSVRRAAFDVADVEQARSFFRELKPLDILVNNAVTMKPRPFASLEPSDFAETYASSVIATFEIVRAAREALTAAADSIGGASVVNVASMYGVVAPDARLYARAEQASPLHYGPAKAALLQLTRHLAAELGPSNIRVNALVPGPFPRGEVTNDEPEFAARLASRTMLRRTGQAEEIAGPLLFLASPASSYMTGAALSIDGGWTAW